MVADVDGLYGVVCIPVLNRNKSSKSTYLQWRFDQSKKEANDQKHAYGRLQRKKKTNPLQFASYSNVLSTTAAA